MSQLSTVDCPMKFIDNINMIINGLRLKPIISMKVFKLNYIAKCLFVVGMVCI